MRATKRTFNTPRLKSQIGCYGIFRFRLLWKISSVIPVSVCYRKPPFVRACLKNHSSNLHAPICGRFCLHSVDVAHYAALIQAKSPTNCNAHLAESIFQTRSSKSFSIPISTFPLRSSPMPLHNPFVLPRFSEGPVCQGFSQTAGLPSQAVL